MQCARNNLVANSLVDRKLSMTALIVVTDESTRQRIDCRKHSHPDVVELLAANQNMKISS